MSLYEEWIRLAYNSQGETIAKVWKDYLPREQKIYEDILANKTTLIDMSLPMFSEKYNVPAAYVCGFADGIKESLINELKPEEMDAGSILHMEISFENLYRKMVEYKAKHLYTLPEWDGIFDEETRDKLRHETNDARIVTRKADKVGRNDPCPCGSGKKYKKCCGA